MHRSARRDPGLSRPDGPEALGQAVVVVIDHGGRTLLVRRAAGRPGAGYWTPVSGRIEPGETAAEAARREVAEEVGLRVEVGAEVHRCAAEGAPFELRWLEARLGAGDEARALRLDEREVSEARWCEASEVATLTPMFAATRAFFARRAGG